VNTEDSLEIPVPKIIDIGPHFLKLFENIIEV